MGPARGTPLPGGRRPARGLAPRPPRPHLRRPGRRAPLVRAQPRAEDVPGPQLRAVPVVRRGARRRGRPAARARLGRARRPAAGAAARGRPAALPHHPRPRPGARPAHPRRPAALRRLHRRRRSGRARRRGVRRLRGAADRGRGARGTRRAGRPERLDRELPRLPQGAQRRRPHPAGDGPGGPVRRRDRARPGRRRVRVARAGARRTVRGVRRAGGPLADRHDRGVLPPPRGRRAGRADRPRRLLRRERRRRAPGRRRRGVRRRGSELGRPGGAQPGPVREAGRAGGPRREPDHVDVAVPRRPDPGRPDHRRALPQRGGGGPRRRPPRAADPPRPGHRRDRGRGHQLAVRLHRRLPAHRLAGHRGGPGRPRLRGHRARAARLAARPAPGRSADRRTPWRPARPASSRPATSGWTR